MFFTRGTVQYDFDILDTFIPQYNVRTIVYNKLVCLDSSVSVQEIMFTLKNWYWDVLVARLESWMKSCSSHPHHLSCPAFSFDASLKEVWIRH